MDRETNKSGEMKDYAPEPEDSSPESRIIGPDSTMVTSGLSAATSVSSAASSETVHRKRQGLSRSSAESGIDLRVLRWFCNVN